jgi:hypothetical protein
VPEVLLLVAALVGNTVGLAWLALAMGAHWRQVSGARPLTRRAVTALRILGTCALLTSLLLCLCADHATMAPLVWIMALAAGALAVAFTLAWRPRLLRPLVAWLRAA